MRCLHVGILTPGTTSRLQADRLCEMVDADWNLVDMHRSFLAAPRWAQTLWFRLRIGPAVRELNRMVQAEIGNASYDLAWIGKGVCLWPTTIRTIRARSKKMIYYTPDTSFLANRSRFFNATAPLYDLVVTTKSFEVANYEQRIPAERLALVTQGYDAEVHYPRCRFEEKRREAVIIGLCEPDREHCVRTLLNCGIPVCVGGKGWQPFVSAVGSESGLRYLGEAIFGDRYVEALSGAMVGLGLLTKRFKELHTTRTMEIPACGTALASERNAETTQMFSESEAIFFDNYEQLGSRLADLFEHPEQLQTITAAGNHRVKTAGFNNQTILTNILLRAGVLI